MEPSSAYITLSSGQVVQVLYQWTFGGMATVAALTVLIVLYSLRWLYEIMTQLWAGRRM